MKKQEKLAVIICNLNKGSTVTDCIQSVLSSIGFDIGSNLKIFVVGNASDETSLQNIQQQYGSQVSLVLSDTDLEGCCAVNLGIKHALAEHFPYICCLGAEITVAPQALKIMFDFITATPNVGLVGGKVYHKHMPHYVFLLISNISERLHILLIRLTMEECQTLSTAMRLEAVA